MSGNWIACHDCDLLQQEAPVPDGGAALCGRCGAVLYRERHNGIEVTLALTVAGLLLFIVANLLPFLAFDMQGAITQTTLATGVVELWEQDMRSLSVLVAITSIVAPGVQLGLLLYVLLPLHFDRIPWQLAGAFRLIRHIQPWSMMEVFLIGILVSLVKLVDMADIVPGLALWSFAALIVVLAAAASALDPRQVWERVEISH